MKCSLKFLTLSVLAASSSTYADNLTTPLQGGNGMITFSGVINNEACSVDETNIHRSVIPVKVDHTVGHINADGIITVDMGAVSIKDMASIESASSGRVTGKDFNLNVNCNSGTKVSMVFDATGGGSGLIFGKNVLALTTGTGTASNVGIALLDSNGALIDLSSKSLAKIQSDMFSAGPDGGDAILNFSAAYVTTGTSETAIAGRGDASLPFVLQYE
ncbi:fimbrial protein [Pseudomonas alkylphenolica]|uniref:P pilus assembly protein, pilin FimA n=1 Tax=Pseudomonas alkylphenolica TaxID=237609 RepID=A0A077FAX0_9PSED|nr:fimbrial protein [Pseudomonas alkylphenolica]AIL62557.1 P pilus assembly protein, pilin FimA [Pseudomonas alkylphenolica]